MKKVVFLILILLVCKASVFSQFDAQLSQYMFHNSSFNPAAVGEGDMIQFSFQHRIQWVGIPNAAKTTVVSLNSPFKFGNTKHGLGFRFFNERIGIFTNQTAHFQYAYKMRLGDGVLSLGADLGFLNLGINTDSIRQISFDGYHNMSADQEIPKVNVSGIGLDLNGGLFYSASNYYLGLSYLHLNNTNVSLTDQIDFKLNGSIYLTGGFDWKIPDTKYIIKPSTLFKTDFRSLQLDLSSRIEYDDKYWGGLSYRIQDAVVIMAGVNVAGGLSIGYSYDLLTSQITTGSTGSHEIVLLYSFEYVFGKRTNKYKSIRIL